MLSVGAVKNLEQNAVGTDPPEVSLVEDLDNVLDIFFIGKTVRHFKIVKIKW